MRNLPNLELRARWSDWPAALQWLGTRRDLETAWRECPRAEWMLGLADASQLPTKKVVLAACAFARTSLQYVPIGESRPLRAIELAEDWTRGTASAIQVRIAAQRARNFRAVHQASDPAPENWASNWAADKNAQAADWAAKAADWAASIVDAEEDAVVWAERVVAWASRAAMAAGAADWAIEWAADWTNGTAASGDWAAGASQAGAIAWDKAQLECANRLREIIAYSDL